MNVERISEIGFKTKRDGTSICELQTKPEIQDTGNTIFTHRACVRAATRLSWRARRETTAVAQRKSKGGAGRKYAKRFGLLWCATCAPHFNVERKRSPNEFAIKAQRKSKNVMMSLRTRPVDGFPSSLTNARKSAFYVKSRQTL